MIDSITRITLNLQETNTMVSIRAKRGDTGRKLLIHLSDGSIPYHISDDCYATFTAKKPDGTKINNACTIENNVIEYEFTDQTCTAVGPMKAEIRLYGADDKMITSACFLVNVYDTVFRDGDEVDSEGEMNTLDDLILRANAFLNETGKLLRWQGNWDSEAEYEANDLVLHQEVLFVAEAAVAAGVEPGSEGSAWVPIAGMGTGSGGEVVGIASVEQTYTAGSGGVNIVTVKLTDGTKSEIKIRNGIPGASIQGPKGERGPMGPQGPAGPAGDDYVLTDADKAEIAEMAAGMVEVPDSGGNVDLTGYATEKYVQEYAQPKGDYLTEHQSLEGYAKTMDIPTKPEDIGAQPSGNYLTEVPSGYATEEFVKNKIAEAELGGEEVDLSGYAKKSELPTKVSQLENDKGYLTEHQDISGYAKKSELPTKVSQLQNDSGYLTEHQSLEGYAKTSEIPTKPEDIGALPDTYTPPNQTAEQVGADPKGTATSAVSQHNTADNSHNDIRLELKALSDRLTAFFDSDDTTLDELSEIVAYITNNKTLIESITTNKVSVADIINNLTTNVSNKPLSAAQGVVLKGLIDTLSDNLANYQPKGDYALRSELPTVPTKVSAFTNDVGYLTEVPEGYAKTEDIPTINLLDNSDFAHFVAQAGVGGNHGNQAYAGDRWILVSGTVTGSESETNSGYYNIKLKGTIKQIVANPPTDGSVFVEMVSGTATASYENGEITITSNGGVIKNVALYEGVYETTPKYHPKGYGAELAECLVYYQSYKPDVIWLTNCPDGYTRHTVLFNTPMRIVPSLLYTFTAKNTEDHILQGRSRNGFRFDTELGSGGWGHVTNLEAIADL